MTINLILIAMRRIILSAALLLLSVTTFAQKHERKVTTFEAGYSVGVSGGATTFGLEARYNFRSPWDVGLRESLVYSNMLGNSSDPVTYDVVTDYNFRQGKNISFFVGVGAGVTTYTYIDWDIKEDCRATMFHFMPRAGVELMNRVRLTAYANTYAFGDKAASWGLSAGLSLGGGKMENRDYNIQHFEFEPFCGISTGGAIVLGLEARYNFNKHWDVGINFAGDFNGSRITAAGDYNFLERKRLTLFGGVGAGWANTCILNIEEAIELYGDACCASMESCFCFYPRVGVELFEHLRLTAAVNTYNFKKAELAITIGAAIGGGKRK